MTLRARLISAALLTALPVASALADPDHDNGNACRNLPNHATLKQQLAAAVTAETSGLNLQMWASIVDRDGVVCAVAFSGVNRGAQWPGSRVISAQKANTGNAFSLDASSAGINGSGRPNGLALSTANLYSAVNPGGSLYGLQHSNPVDTETAYSGNPGNYGQPNDPMVGKRIGGVNIFGGGFALYKPGRVIVGGLGVSGDTSCADHRIGWRLRRLLDLDHLLGVDGVSGDPNRPDNIIYLGAGETPNGFKHPDCGGGDNPADLPVVRP
jgi:uncharacterized protein GlcG (DUF336 family)